MTGASGVVATSVGMDTSTGSVTGDVGSETGISSVAEPAEATVYSAAGSSTIGGIFMSGMSISIGISSLMSKASTDSATGVSVGSAVTSAASVASPSLRTSFSRASSSTFLLFILSSSAESLFSSMFPIKKCYLCLTNRKCGNHAAPQGLRVLLIIPTNLTKCFQKT